eukprot:CAMPEP_0179176628 /NCGR_PEP_ID=MMETSP0796-20121207/87339_1 /TAXON_ID=73915 /ORGANISM="Pyrodinium bahamense, Strain pbaha01" /LENGTH=97 /DNA_ID=CAMNT_0020880167 /DNA_START=124 /DNA_END=415 /DNA_ORIENTATION=+
MAALDTSYSRWSLSRAVPASQLPVHGAVGAAWSSDTSAASSSDLAKVVDCLAVSVFRKCSFADEPPSPPLRAPPVVGLRTAGMPPARAPSPETTASH